jgi:hypothetical protein
MVEKTPEELRAEFRAYREKHLAPTLEAPAKPVAFIDDTTEINATLDQLREELLDALLPSEAVLGELVISMISGVMLGQLEDPVIAEFGFKEFDVNWQVLVAWKSELNDDRDYDDGEELEYDESIAVRIDRPVGYYIGIYIYKDEYDRTGRLEYQLVS